MFKSRCTFLPSSEDAVFQKAQNEQSALWGPHQPNKSPDQTKLHNGNGRSSLSPSAGSTLRAGFIRPRGDCNHLCHGGVANKHRDNGRRRTRWKKPSWSCWQTPRRTRRTRRPGPRWRCIGCCNRATKSVVGSCSSSRRHTIVNTYPATFWTRPQKTGERKPQTGRHQCRTETDIRFAEDLWWPAHFRTAAGGGGAKPVRFFECGRPRLCARPVFP